MDMNAVLTTVATAVAADAATAAWCEATYSKALQVYIGLDERFSPEAAVFPVVSIYMRKKAAGDDETRKMHGIGFTAGVYDETDAAPAPDGPANLTVKNGIGRLEALRYLIEAAATKAGEGLGLEVPKVDTVYEPLDMYPFFMATVEIEFGEDRSQGDDAFQ